MQKLGDIFSGFSLSIQQILISIVVYNLLCLFFTQKTIPFLNTLYITVSIEYRKEKFQLSKFFFSFLKRQTSLRHTQFTYMAVVQNVDLESQKELKVDEYSNSKIFSSLSHLRLYLTEVYSRFTLFVYSDVKHQNNNEEIIKVCRNQ